MTLPSLEKSDLPDLFDNHDIEVRDRDNARIEHWPIIAVAWFFAEVFGGRGFEGFWMGLPRLFSSGSTVYTNAKTAAKDVRSGNVSHSEMSSIVHELTHCFQWIELGILAAIAYVVFPLVTYWTSRSTLEFEADANEILNLLNRYGYYDDYVGGLCESSASIFSGPTYCWATTDEQGWYRALKRTVAYAKIEDEPVDARGITVRFGLHELFGGYNLRSQ